MHKEKFPLMPRNTQKALLVQCQGHLFQEASFFPILWPLFSYSRMGGLKWTRLLAPYVLCQDSVLDCCGQNHGCNPKAIFQSSISQIILQTQRPLLCWSGTAPSLLLKQYNYRRGTIHYFRQARAKGIEFSTLVRSRSFKRSGEDDLHPRTTWASDSYTLPYTDLLPITPGLRGGMWKLHVCQQNSPWDWRAQCTPTTVVLLKLVIHELAT